MSLSLASARPARALGLFCCAIVALQACGGRSDTEDFRFSDDLPLGGSAASGGASNNGASSSGGKKPGNAGGSTTTAGTSPVGGASQGGAALMGGTGAGGGSAGFPQGGFAQAGTSIGGSGPVIPVTCGEQICDSLTQTCCASLGGFGCIPRDQECVGATLACGSTADCTDDQVCCLRLVGDASASSQCKDVCDGMGPGRERRLCTSDMDCDGPRPRCRVTTFGVSVCTRF